MNRISKFLILIPVLFGLSACAHQRNRDQDYGQYPGPAAYYGQQTQYGSVRSIEAVDSGRHASGGGALAGALIGGVIGNQIGSGSGSGRDAATVVGAIGGAIVGNQVEKQGGNRRSAYRVHVRLDQGGEAQFEFEDLAGLRVGDRVRVEGGRLYRM